MNRIIKITYVFCVIWIVTLLFTSNQTYAQSIISPNFSDISLFTINGAAQKVGSVLHLTPDKMSKAGSAFLSSSLSINQDTSIQTEFVFRISGRKNGGPMGSDGLAFVIHNDPRGAAAIGNDGASQGFGEVPTSPDPPISPSVAVEFDTHNNSSFDPGDNYVGVILNGDVRNHQASAKSSLLFNSGDPLFVWIDYDGSTDLLEVYLSGTDLKPALPLLSTTLDLFSVVGPEAFFGFSAGTGGGFNVHDIILNEPAGKTQIPGINPQDMTGAGMDGMVVIADFSDGTSEAKLWEDIDPSSGGVFGTGWSLTESGDTFGGIWTLTRDYTYQARELTRIWIDALTGGSVFDTGFVGELGVEYDISLVDEFGTDGSALGWTLDLQSAPSNLDIDVTYSDAVALIGQDPVGDIFRYLEIDFTNPGGFAAGDTLTFIADTDKVVPEPSTLLLLGSGLIGVIAFRRRRTKK